MSYFGTNCSFNGNLLTTFSGSAGNGINITGIEHAGKSAKQAQTYALSHGNKSAIPFVEYPSKPITLTGTIIGTSISDCDNQIDTFNSLISPTNAAFCVDYAGGSLNRQYIGTFQVPNVTRAYGLAWADFNATFTSINPFGTDTTTTSLLNDTGQTLSSYNYSITTAGSAPFQLPVITITFSAIGSAPVAGTVSVGNSALGEQINITRTWSATDVLVIDTSLSTNTPVTVNGLPVNFTGAFPAFFTGAGTLSYSDTFASRTFAILVVYYRSFL